MKDINLLPVIHDTGRQRRLLAGSLLLGFLVTALFIQYGIFAPLRAKEEGLRRAAALETALEKRVMLEAAAEELVEEQAVLGDRLFAFHTLNQGSPLLWSRVMHTLFESLPEHTHITGVVCDHTTLVVSGFSPDDLLAAAFYSQLKRSPLFETVSLERLTYLGREETAFQLRCTMILTDLEDSPP